ncbi:hypothetical protein BGX34_003892 [Mortierella sp. NVP85]|nr:hypothetical protein BGX34_003892 [Mortierella sp. NVP85]
MRFSTIVRPIAAIAAAVAVSAAPVMLASSHDRTAKTLNYALTLERLQSEFYKQGLDKFDAQAFTDAGFGGDIRDHFVLIREQEDEHVALLTSAITSMKGDPVPACEYNFPLDTLTQFLSLSQALENTGVSAYLGAIKSLSGDLLTAAAAITTAEARHASYLNELWGQNGYPYALDTVLTPEQIVTMASSFIKCPYDLGVESYHPLKATLSAPDSMMVNTEFSGDHADEMDETWCQFLYGTKTAVSPRRDCELPEDAAGYVFVLVTDSDEPVTTSQQDNILAGPALLYNGTSIH